LQPDEQWSQSLAKTSLDGGRLEARLTDFKTAMDSASVTAPDRPAVADHLASDNTATAVLPGRARQRVLLVSPGSIFLQKVFEAHPLVDLTTATALPETFPEDTLIVLHQLVPAVLPSQPLLVIDPAVSSDHWTIGAPLENPLAVEWDEQSPLMTFVRLDQVVMPAAQRLTFAAPVHVLAETPEGDPLYVQWTRSSVPGLLLNVNLEQSDLAFRTTFPILIGNALNWFAGETGDSPAARSTGEVATMPLPHPAHGTSWQLVDPAGIPASLIMATAGNDSILSGTVPETMFTTGPLDRAGIWTIRTSRAGTSPGESPRPVTADPAAEYHLAVNVASPRESDLRPATALASADEVALTQPERGGRPLWMLLIVAACVLTGVEWMLSQRRILE
jgi:hypothetical protein